MNKLKIKNSVDLNILMDFGYSKTKNKFNTFQDSFIKIFDKQLDDILKLNNDKFDFMTEIDLNTRIILLKAVDKAGQGAFGYDDEMVIKPYIEDLIEDDLVECIKDE